MSLKTMKKEDLELLTFTDLTEMILSENKKAMNTPAIFRNICDLLKLSDSEYTSKIGDFYTSLTLDKRFLLLDSAEWDLRDRHAIDIVIADDDDDEVVEEIDDVVIDEEESSGDEVSLDVITDDDLDDNDDLDDLVIVDEDELEEN